MKPLDLTAIRSQLAQPVERSSVKAWVVDGIVCLVFAIVVGLALIFG